MVADGTIPPREDSASIADSDDPSFTEVGRNLGAAWVAAQVYLLVQAARLRVVFRNFLLLAILGAFTAFIALTILISSAVLLMIGIADGLASLLGDRQWAGDLIVGMVVVAGAGLTGYVMVARMLKSFRRQPMSGYEKQKSRN
jgi:hypothetical protein